jgi:hypothetical protein
MAFQYPDPATMTDEELLAAERFQLPPLAEGARVPSALLGSEPVRATPAAPLTQADLQAAPPDYARFMAPDAPAQSPAAPMSVLPPAQPSSFGQAFAPQGMAGGAEPYRATTHTQTTKMSMTPEERTAVGDITKAQAGQEAAVAARGKLLAQGAGIGAEEAGAREQFAQGRIADVERNAAADSDAWTNANAKVDEETRKLKEIPLGSWWDNKSTGDRVMAALAVAAGAIGANGGANQAYGILQDAVQNYRKDQLAKIDRQKDNVAMARMGVKDAMMAREMQRTNLEAKVAAQYDALASRFATQKAKLGVPAAEIEADQLVQDLRTNAAQQRQAIYQGLRSRTVTDSTRISGTSMPGMTGAGGKPTGEQLKATSQFNELLPAIKTLQQTGGLSRKGAEAIKGVEAWRGATPEGVRGLMESWGWADTPETALKRSGRKGDDEARNAQLAVFNYVVQGLTGAAVSTPEMRDRFGPTYLRQPSDTEEVARVKNERLIRKAIDLGMVQGAQPAVAAQQAQQALQEGQAARAPRAIVYNGRPAMQYPDGSISYR